MATKTKHPFSSRVRVNRSEFPCLSLLSSSGNLYQTRVVANYSVCDNTDLVSVT